MNKYQVKWKKAVHGIIGIEARDPAEAIANVVWNIINGNLISDTKLELKVEEESDD